MAVSALDLVISGERALAHPRDALGTLCW